MVYFSTWLQTSKGCSDVCQVRLDITNPTVCQVKLDTAMPLSAISPCHRSIIQTNSHYGRKWTQRKGNALHCIKIQLCQGQYFLLWFIIALQGLRLWKSFTSTTTWFLFSTGDSRHWTCGLLLLRATTMAPAWLQTSWLLPDGDHAFVSVTQYSL